MSQNNSKNRFIGEYSAVSCCPSSKHWATGASAGRAQTLPKKIGDVALVLLKMMGQSETVASAILAADVPAALSRLTAGIEAAKTAPSVVDEAEDSPQVSLSNRALPLINLLTVAEQADSDVMWK